MISSHFNLEKTHHAYLIEGVYESSWPEIKKFLEDLNFKTENNPDFFTFLVDSFKIDDARKIRSLSSEKSISSSEKKIFIISANRFLLEAQNALLKMFEEPNPNTHLFIITPDTSALLKTLVSRFYLIKDKRENKIKEAESFIRMSIKDRLAFIKENFASKDEEGEAVSVRTEVSRFLDSLEEALHNKFFKKDYRQTINTSLFDQVFIAREYLRQNGSSPKSLLEGVALSVPEF